MAEQRQAIHSPEAPGAVGAYSHGVAANGLLFCSAQLPLDPESGELVEGGIGSSVKRCLDSLAAVSGAAGGTIAGAVRLTLYLTDLERDWDEVNEHYGAFFDALGTVAPARAVVGVAALPKGAPIAIDAIVALPS